jgi:tripeptidyl-peptidase-1
LTGPKEESVSLVKEWLQSEISSSKISVAGDYLTVEGTVNAVEKLLKTTYSTYGKNTPFFTP